MSDLKLGILLGDAFDSYHRDAAHVAVMPATAGEQLVPGSHVGFIKDSSPDLVGVRTKQPFGVVDPFLKQPLNIGERFYVLMYPESVTVLRHAWEHPALARAEAVKFLNDLAENRYMSYDELMEKLKTISEGDYNLIGANSPTDYPELFNTKMIWKSYEIATGTKVSNQNAVFEFCC